MTVLIRIGFPQEGSRKGAKAQSKTRLATRLRFAPLRLCGKLLLVLLCLALLLSGCKQAATDAPSAAPVAEQAAAPSPSPSPTPPRPSGPIEYTDVTSEAGIRFKHNSGAFGKKYLPETIGAGAAFLDYNNDGWQDILLVNSMDWPESKKRRSFPALYHNNKDGTFTDVTQQAGLGVEMYGIGVAVGDYDNDGWDDVYVTCVGNNHLFRNLGNGKFADVTTRAGLAEPGFSTSAAWFDYDNDGKLDLFVGNYVEWSVQTDQHCSLDGKNKSYCTPQSYKGQSSQLYRNRGNGTFENVTARAGVNDPAGKTLGIALLDYDDDGWMDLFVANDTEPNKLYRNNHNGTFTDNGVIAGVAFSEAGTARAGMGVDAADYDGSGKPGVVIGNFTNESIALYHNDGSGLFTDEASSSGIGKISAQSLTFACFFFDYNLDGLLDIFAANGHVSDDISVVQPTVKYAQPPHLFQNKGRKKFEEVTAKLGRALNRAIVGRGAAYGDYDNDGDLDLLLTTNNGPARLLRNDNANQNDVLRLKTIGAKANRNGIGAKVVVKTSKGRTLYGVVRTGSSYCSQSELPLVFGLGKPEEGTTLTIEITWPGNQKDRIADVKPNQIVTVQEGKGATTTEPIVFVRTPPAQPSPSASPE
ncbi:MAG TPA: CRTAC1 family protein [Pyrinomonadaceae bacterium]|nr:CRTAC1 family protein [Pyrinomonadaceae bacterium]